MNRAERLDFFQNITIALLSVSAVFLFSRTEIFRLAWETAEERFHLTARLPSRASPETDLSTPIRLAASTPYGRHADLFLTTDSPAFDPAGRLLAAALSRRPPLPQILSDQRDGPDQPVPSAQGDPGELLDQTDHQTRTDPQSRTEQQNQTDPHSRTDQQNQTDQHSRTDQQNRTEIPSEWEDCTQDEFLHTLDRTSLYFDFLHPLPLSLLAGLADAVCPEDREARYAVLTVEEDGTALYLWDGQDQQSHRAAPVTAEELEEAVGQYQPVNASFAMDHVEPEESRWQALASLSLLPGRTPSLPQLSAVSGSSGSDALLTALRFNPLTNSRYPEPNGTEVVVEGSRTVRIRANGSIYYQAGGGEDQSVLAVESAGEVPTPWEAAAGCAALLRSLTGSGGGGTLYPCEVWQEGSRTFLRFDYQFSGVPIRFSDGHSAAEVTLEGRAVSALELRPRQYTAAEWESLLLPLPQALGIAALRPGGELVVGYSDDGSGQIGAVWMTSP